MTMSIPSSLQKGERWAALDHHFLLGASRRPALIISYDVSCQFRTRLRMDYHRTSVSTSPEEEYLPLADYAAWTAVRRVDMMMGDARTAEEPQQPLEGERIYLVSGPDCKLPGAYVSWPSANAEYTKHSSASVKSYTKWQLAQSAWWAGCDRGDHVHPGAGAIASPSPSRAVHRSNSAAPTPARALTAEPSTPSKQPISTKALPVFRISSRSPSPVSAKPRSPKKSSTRGDTATGRKVYAIRARDDPTGGVIFSDYLEARSWYNLKQAGGLAPIMVTGTSITNAVNFTECLPEIGPEALMCRDLIAEEDRARRQKVKADFERAARRRTVLEDLEGARQDAGSESAHSSDESDVSRSTASLVSELQARVEYGEEWRYYRSDGGHGKH
ncbi:hypothetical protein B0H13DRAFT_2379554 [Mycena leptocephala]|nr:hypothetical protein B0H13DRAFT_2379554 [Mycena leptocephala]